MSEHENELVDQELAPEDAGTEPPAESPAPHVEQDDEPAPATEGELVDDQEEREPHPHSPGYGVTRKFPVPETVQVEDAGDTTEERDQ